MMASMAKRLVLPEKPTGLGRFVPDGGSIVGTDTYRDLDNFADAEPIPGLLIYRIDDAVSDYLKP